MAGSVSIKLDGVRQVRAALIGAGTVDAQRAQKTARREARKKARSLAAKAIAGRWALPAKILRKRVMTYLHEGTIRLWMGLRHRPRASEHAAVRRALLRLGDRRRRVLPIEQGAEPVLISSARDALITRYIPVLRRDYQRRIQKRSQRARRRR